MRLLLLPLLGGLPWAAVSDDYADCNRLQDFVDNCIGGYVNDAQYDEMCEDYGITSSDDCVKEAEYAIFYLEQMALVECQQPSGPLSETSYERIERFKYQCKGDFDGPCNLIRIFEEECITPLSEDHASLEESELCSLQPVDESVEVPVTCIAQSQFVFDLEQEYLSACRDEGMVDYFTVERFKYECAQYDSTCASLEHFVERCVPLTVIPASNYEELCKAYVWGLVDDTFPMDATSEAEQAFCMKEAKTYLGMTPPELGNCEHTLSSAELDFFAELQDYCAPFVATTPTPAPTQTKAPTVPDGPCGYLLAFDGDCLVDSAAARTSEFAAMCEMYVWGVGLESASEEEQSCALRSPVVYDLPEQNMNSCMGSLGADRRARLDAFGDTCAGIVDQTPTAFPSSTPAPTLFQGGGPCQLLEEFSANCMPLPNVEVYCDAFDVEKIDDFASNNPAPAVDISCVGEAQSVLFLPRQNLGYCRREEKTSEAALTKIDALRLACFPAPTRAPAVAPAPAPAPATGTAAPTTAVLADEATKSKASSASSSTIALAVILPLAVILLGAFAYAAKKGKLGGSASQRLDDEESMAWKSRFGDEDEDEGDRRGGRGGVEMRAPSLDRPRHDAQAAAQRRAQQQPSSFGGTAGAGEGAEVWDVVDLPPKAPAAIIPTLNPPSPATGRGGGAVDFDGFTANTAPQASVDPFNTPAPAGGFAGNF